MIVFKYKQEPLGNGQSIARPVADVYLKTKNNSWIEFHPYIDSGADITMIPLSLGRLIGLHLDESKVVQIGGIRGSVPVIYDKSTIKIGSEIFQARISWSLIEDVPPLLGRTDVFDRFDVTFKQRERQILLSSHPML
ncbi:MAG TPA: hypothetical protein VJL83_02380 [Patescibacteria group bacterium]|nr:hypothetical protein [Patescibacteria group bacterium]